MSFNTIRKDVEEYLAANWATTGIQYANTKFTTPPSEFVRVNVILGDTTQMSMGASQDHRTLLLITLGIFVKVNTGTGTSLGYADTLGALFTNKTIGVVNTRVASVNIIGENNGFFQINLVVPAWSDEVI